MKKVILGLAALGLMACSNNDGSKANTGDGALIPNQISEKPLVQKAALNDAQKEEIQKFMAGSNLIPESDLIVTPKIESDTQKNRRLEKIQKLSKDQKEILDGLVANCDAPAPTEATEGDTNKAGSKSTTKSKSSVSGAQCPIQYEEDSVSENLVQSTNIDSIQAEYDKSHDSKAYENLKMVQNIKTSIDSHMKVVEAELQKKSGVLERSSTTSSSGVLVVSGMKASTYTRSSGQYSAQTMSGSAITVDATNEFLVNSDQKTSGYFRFDFHMPSSEPTLQVYVTPEGKRYYLNGQQMSEQEMKDLFGNSFSFDIN